MSKKRRKNKKYSAELKLQAVHSYLKGEGSLRDISKKYGILSRERLRQWVLWYNGHKEFKVPSYVKGGMIKS